MKESNGSTQTFGELPEGELLFLAAAVAHPPQRTGVGPFASPAFHDVAGEVEVTWLLRDHAQKSNMDTQEPPIPTPEACVNIQRVAPGPGCYRLGTSRGLCGKH